MTPKTKQALELAQNVLTFVISTPATVALNAVNAALAESEPVRLTDADIYEMYSEPCSDAEMVAFAREVEAAVLEKNK
jgi:glutamate racemase